jgi:predicted membrane protein
MDMRYARLTALSAIITLTFAASVAAQDFTRSYSPGPDATVSISNISGNIRVVGSDNPAVVVAGYKEGRDREVVEILDRSSGNRVEIKVKYPENCNCDASVRFEVQVPRNLALRYDPISSISGDVEVSNVSGSIRAKSISGRVNIQATSGVVNASSVSGNVTVRDAGGAVSAKSTSGEVDVDMTRIEGGDKMEFSSTSGNVTVRLPANADADVEMSVLSGSLKTDFPLQIEKREYGPGRRAWGFIGAGARKLRLSSVSGDVTLSRM